MCHLLLTRPSWWEEDHHHGHYYHHHHHWHQLQHPASQSALESFVLFENVLRNSKKKESNGNGNARLIDSTRPVCEAKVQEEAKDQAHVIISWFWNLHVESKQRKMLNRWQSAKVTKNVDLIPTCTWGHEFLGRKKKERKRRSKTFISFSGPYCRGVGQVGQYRRRDLGQVDRVGAQSQGCQSLCQSSCLDSQRLWRWLWRIQVRPEDRHTRLLMHMFLYIHVFCRIGVGGFENPMRDAATAEVIRHIGQVSGKTVQVWPWCRGQCGIKPNKFRASIIKFWIEMKKKRQGYLLRNCFSRISWFAW